MKRLTIGIWLGIATMLLTGCFQVERVVTVRPDGSGKYEETVLLSKKAVTAMQSAFGGEDKKNINDFELSSPEELKQAAGTMGSGVRFVASQKVVTDSFVGYRASYAFSDISQLQLDNGPPNLDKKPRVVNAETAVRFIFTPGSTATLRLRSPKAGLKEQTGEQSQPTKTKKQPDPKELAMMKEMLDGMRVSLTIVINGTIVKTNATHRSGNRITVADMDFSKLLSLSPDEFSQLNSADQNNFAAAMETLKKIPGIRFDLNEELQVQFR